MKATHGLYGFALLWFISVSAGAQVSQDCKDDHFCYRRVPGAVCADGTPTGFQVMYRKGARNLFILMGGGGACWDYNTCTGGNAIHLTEHKLYEGDYFAQPASSQEGWRNLKDPNNPISEGFHYVHIPYCTADVFTGDRVVDYGTSDKPFKVHHKGYTNTLLILDELKKRFPNPDKILFYGVSAGGLGVSWHAANLADLFPQSDIHVINDGGLPFKPPFVGRLKLKAVFNAWGAEKNMPEEVRKKPLLPNDSYATLMIRYVQDNYPDLTYGFISSYKDYIMSYFSRLLKALNWTRAVRETMVSLADEEFARSPNFKVFYLNDWAHVYFGKDPSKTVSLGVPFGTWASAMIGQNSYTWSNVRPDLSGTYFAPETGAGIPLVNHLRWP